MATSQSDPRPTLQLSTICIDCPDANEMAAFYGQLLGWEVGHQEPEFVILCNPTGGIGLSFQSEANYRVPVWPEEASGQDKMLHLDIHVEDLEAAVAHAQSCGARLAGYQPQEGVRVLLDPAGHPFCLFR